MLIIYRLSKADRYNNVEVTSISSKQLQNAFKGQKQQKAIIKVTSHSLSTNYQPVSIVITGKFKYDSVVVKDDTSNDYEDVPESMSSFSWWIVIIIIVAIVVVLGCLFVCCGCGC